VQVQESQGTITTQSSNESRTTSRDSEKVSALTSAERKRRRRTQEEGVAETTNSAREVLGAQQGNI